MEENTTMFPLLMCLLSGGFAFALGILFSTRMYKRVRTRQEIEQFRQKLYKNLRAESQLLEFLSKSGNTEEYNKQIARVSGLYYQCHALGWVISLEHHEIKFAHSDEFNVKPEHLFVEYVRSEN